MLDTQVHIKLVDTGDFYSRHERYLHNLNCKIRAERKELKKEISKETNDIIKKYDLKNKDFGNLVRENYEKFNINKYNEIDKIYILNFLNKYKEYKKILQHKNKKIKELKNQLLILLSNKINSNITSNGKHHKRKLKSNLPSSKNISVFESDFTRMIGVKSDEYTDDFMIVQIYYFDILKDLIFFGFEYKNEKYIYFTSSAGQIRKKKCVFIKESIWNKYNKKILCGLSFELINKKGGINPNKYLAYIALHNSATDVWKKFDIDKTIVIDDFETNVYGTYDLIDDIDFTVKRITDYVPITHTDGVGMMLPCMGENKMIRMPWIKGLLASFDYVKFIKDNHCSPIIKDIYGKEHDIITEEIQIILTKSQFKMWKYYDSWEQYRQYYKKYGCETGYTNCEEERIKDTTINYQMLQTLTDITDDEIKTIVNPSINRLNNFCSSVNNIYDIFGVTPYNQYKTAFQKSIELYPNLLNDEFVKSKLRDTKNSLVKKYKAGKLKINGKYTFILPDLYAACQYWFLGIENPEGLLNNGDVFCWLFRKDEKLDCLRSPHLFKEHAIRINKGCDNYKNEQEKIREWFTTDALYTSCHDMISKILQFDVDGDKSLVVSDKNFVNIAERNMRGIVPLYYNMKKSEPTILNKESIYNGLIAAFVNGNIGMYSNDISKIWNSEVFISGTEKEKQEAIDLVKILCMENNFTIDYAKTLYKPIRPKEIHDKIIKFTKSNVPYFFIYAKDKEEYQVDKINDSFCNKIVNLVPNPRVNFRWLNIGEIDYTLLMSNPSIDCKVVFDNHGKIIKEKTDPMIIKYNEFNKKYHYKISNIDYVNSFCGDILMKSKVRQNLIYHEISKEIKEGLSVFGYSENEIADILVKLLYHETNSKHKNILWICYGDYIYNNLKKHLKPKSKSIKCVDCGKWFNVVAKDNRTCRCHDCKIGHKRKLTNIRSRNFRERKRRLKEKDAN